jgi:hypothetical protein
LVAALHTQPKVRGGENDDKGLFERSGHWRMRCLLVRARSLKPGLFSNELLAVADTLYTVIFQGLWCMADRAGRLENKPARIHLKINPGRSMDGTVRALDWLEDNGFIERYVAEDQRQFIQVLEFAKHQHPHHKEPQSIIPPPRRMLKVSDQNPGQDTGEPGTKPAQPLGETGASPGRTLDLPQCSPSDSGLLNPDLDPSLPFLADEPPPQAKPAERIGTNPKALGSNPRALGTNPRATGSDHRALPRQSLEAWRAATEAIDHVKLAIPAGLTWAYVAQTLRDPLAIESIEHAGGYRRIADRSRFTQKDLARRFRYHYEKALKQAEAKPKSAEQG